MTLWSQGRRPQALLRRYMRSAGQHKAYPAATVTRKRSRTLLLLRLLITPLELVPPRGEVSFLLRAFVVRRWLYQRLRRRCGGSGSGVRSLGGRSAHVRHATTASSGVVQGRCVVRRPFSRSGDALAASEAGAEQGGKQRDLPAVLRDRFACACASAAVVCCA